MKTKFLVSTLAVILIISVISVAAYINYNPGASQNKGACSVTDDEGYTTEFTTTPQKIISLAPSNTQILFAIGVGDRVVGVTDYDNYPYDFSAWIEAGNMTSIGGFSNPNKEVITSLQPDLILATNIHDSYLPAFRDLGYKVLVLNPKNVSSVLNDILMVGKATGAEENAANLVDSINAEIDSIAAKLSAANVAKPTVYYEVWYPPLMSASGSSFIGDVITLAGGQNIFENETDQYPTVSSETIVNANPQVILLPTDMATTGESPFYGSLDQVKARPGWDTISAVQNNRIVIVDGDLFAQPGPRIAEQIEVTAKALYPELFNST
ncbi:MAG: ABC transporter substrate-binding protein [Candidatus Bathyarchaeia archaeon]|jgi:iron complex transport system substrate-binding protein